VSQYFQVGDRVLWNPSNRVADLFVGQADALVAIANAPHGMRPTGQDEFEMDLVAFEAFVDALTRVYLGSSHQIMRALLEGFLATAVVLVDRARGGVSALAEPPALDQSRCLRRAWRHRPARRPSAAARAGSCECSGDAVLTSRCSDVGYVRAWR
jgi:hypothetical protein